MEHQEFQLVDQVVFLIEGHYCQYCQSQRSMAFFWDIEIF